MAGRLILLCPGQGGQHPAMFDLARSDPAAARLLDAWCGDATLAPLLHAAIEGTARYNNQVAQASIVAATLATWLALRTRLPEPMLVAGYSIGELAAYGVAGALEPRDIPLLAAGRARLMDACVAPDTPQCMVALSGMPEGVADALLERFGFHPAIVTGEDSMVAGGRAARREALLDAAGAAGGRATALPVEVASHTPLLADAVAPLRNLLQGQRWSPPSVPVLSGISAEAVHDSGRAVDRLARQVAEPVLWRDCMDACAEGGATVALELGPGAALSRMLQARHPQIACRSVSEFRSLDGIHAWLERQLG